MADAPYFLSSDLDPPPIVPPREPIQVVEDRKRNEQQTRFLAPTAVQQTSTDELDDSEGMDDLARLLFERRRGARGVRLSTAPTNTGGWSLVVPGQLMARVPEALVSDFEEVLSRNTSFGVAQQPVPGLDCPELQEGLTFLEYTRDVDEEDSGQRRQRNDDMNSVLSELNALSAPDPNDPTKPLAVKASPTLVTALQRVIVKAAIGPAPTTVDTDEAFRLAGLHAPSGEVVVAVIDTGIANVRRADGWLNEVPRGSGRIDPLDAFPAPGNGLLDFAAGHGTFAAGIVRLVDPEARIRVYQALDSDGFADENAVGCAMIQAVKDGAHVVNLSFGMKTVDGRPSVALHKALEVVNQICRELPRPRPVIVAAAGNYGDEEKVWPAAFSGEQSSAPEAVGDMVVSVAALNAEDGEGIYHGADWSTRGTWVTCCSVGSGIVSTFVPGDEDPRFFELRSNAPTSGSNAQPDPNPPEPDHYPSPDEGDSWAVWSGTSFAAPQIAGAISRVCREMNMDPLVAAAELLNRADSLPSYPRFGKAIVVLPGT